MKCMSKACHALANWGIWEKRKTIPGTPMDYHLMQINWTLSLPYWRDRIVWVASYDVWFQNRQKAWTSKSSYVMKTSPFSAPKVNQSSQSLVQLSGFLYSILGPACHNTLNNSTNFLLGILLLIVLYHLPQTVRVSPYISNCQDRSMSKIDRCNSRFMRFVQTDKSAPVEMQSQWFGSHFKAEQVTWGNLRPPNTTKWLFSFHFLTFLRLKKTHDKAFVQEVKRTRRDLNPRSPAPKAGALIQTGLRAQTTITQGFD